MEAFYSNPFSQDSEADELCYTNVQSLNQDAAPPLWTETPTEKDFISVSSALRYQAQLSEALRANSTLRGTYEAHIETQRKEIDRLGTENSELLKKVTRLESQMRSFELEKECSTMAYKREVEKNTALEEKIASLEAELNSLTRRAQELNATYGGTVSRTDAWETSAAPTAAHPPQQNYRAWTAPSHAGAEGRRAPEPPRLDLEQRRYAPEAQPQRGDGGMTARATAREPPGGFSLFSGGGENEANAATVSALERQLLRECQLRDELESELQKMERTKIRSGSERAKKISLERDLNAAQQAISDTRRRLRGLSALIR